MMVIVYGANAIYFDTAPNNSQPIGGLRGDFTAFGTGAIGTGELSVPYPRACSSSASSTTG